MTVMRAVLLGIAVVLAMVVASVRAEPDRWPAVVVWAGRMQRAASLELPPCPAVGREVSPGERVDGYAEAVRRMQTRDRSIGDRLHALATDRSEWPLTPADRERLAALAPALDELRAAVRCERREPIAVAAAEALVDAVRALAVLARERPATADAEVALAVGRDLWAESDPLVRLFGALALELTATALDDAWLAAVPLDELATFAETLARIDPPTMPTLGPASACAGVVQHLAGNGDVDPHLLGMRSPLAAWRNGFSLRRAGMDRALEVAAAVQQFDEDSPVDEAWPARRLRLTKLMAEEAAAGGYARMPWFVSLDEHEAAARRGVACLRLLRIAVAVRLGQELPVLTDPLGRGPVRRETVDGVDFAACGDDPVVRRRVLR